MNLKEIKELVDLITEKGITEFELERSGVRLRILRGVAAGALVSVEAGSGQPAAAGPAAASLAAAAGPGETRAVEAPAEDLHVVKSPIVGTFYSSPSPGAPPFVKPGDRVKAGQVLCIVEAMKLMNEIESDVAGEIVTRFVENGQPVEYGEALFALRPDKGKG